MSSSISWRPPFQDANTYAAFDTVNAVASAEHSRVLFGAVAKDPRRLLVEDKPWEPRIDNGYPNVHYDPADSPPYRLWYDCCIEVADRSVCHGSDTKATLYAESDDGVSWRKPELGRVKFAHSKQNNIVMRDTHGLGIWRDHHETDPARAFKAFGRYQKMAEGSVRLKKEKDRAAVRAAIEVLQLPPWMSNLRLTADVPSLQLRRGDLLFRPTPAGGEYRPQMSLADLDALSLPADLGVKYSEKGGVASSPDGLRWSAWRELRLDNRWDTHSNMFYDERRREYVGFTRGDTYARDGRGGYALNRTVARTAAASFDGAFSSPVQVVHAGSGLDDQFYAQVTFPFYSAYLGLIAEYDSHFARDGPDDKVRCELGWSPDSVRWYRLTQGKRADAPHARELIPTGGELGRDDAFDCFYANRPVVVQPHDGSGAPEVRMYYMGGDGPHFGARNTFLRLATMRMDGFAGQAPAHAHRAAVVTSRPLPCGCEPPALTADVHAGGGSVRVAVMVAPASSSSDGGGGNGGGGGDNDDGDTSGYAPLAGRSLADAVPIEASVTRARAAWRSSSSSSDATAAAMPMPGPGRRCVLVFELRNATLYTFGWPPSGPAVAGVESASAACDGDAAASSSAAAAASVVDSPPPPMASPPPPSVAAKPTTNAHADGEKAAVTNALAAARPVAVTVAGGGVIDSGGVAMDMDDAALALGLAKLFTALVFGSVTVWMGVVCVARGQEAQRRGGAGDVGGGLLDTAPSQTELTEENLELHETATSSERRASGKPLMEEL